MHLESGNYLLIRYSGFYIFMKYTLLLNDSICDLALLSVYTSDKYMITQKRIDTDILHDRNAQQCECRR